MDSKTITPATLTEGGDTVVSFGSGEPGAGGRTQASARGRGGVSNASPRQVSALRGRISRNTDLSATQRRNLLREIDDNRKPNGRITRRILGDIAEDFDNLR
jgi:hypothetical protein